MAKDFEGNEIVEAQPTGVKPFRTLHVHYENLEDKARLRALVKKADVQGRDVWFTGAQDEVIKRKKSLEEEMAAEEDGE